MLGSIGKYIAEVSADAGSHPDFWKFITKIYTLKSPTFKYKYEIDGTCFFLKYFTASGDRFSAFFTGRWGPTAR